MYNCFNRTTLLLVLGGFVLCPVARAVGQGTSRNPYRRIIERNLFRLKPAPIPVVDLPHTPLPVIKLTGITSILGDKRALLKIRFPAQPPAQPREESCILKEGQSDGPIKVLQIDMKSAMVKLDDAGKETVITFTNEPSTAATPSAALAPSAQSQRYPRRWAK